MWILAELSERILSQITQEKCRFSEASLGRRGVALIGTLGISSFNFNPGRQELISSVTSIRQSAPRLLRHLVRLLDCPVMIGNPRRCDGHSAPRRVSTGAGLRPMRPLP